MIHPMAGHSEDMVTLEYSVPRSHPSWRLPDGCIAEDGPTVGSVPTVATPSESTVTLAYSVPRSHPSWVLSEETMPESELHAEVLYLLQAILKHWAKQSGARIVRNLAVRWTPEDARLGADPDLAVLLPPPPDDSLVSLRTWLPGHAAPLVAIEVVSETNPRKDYTLAPEKYAASGTRELWIFDPLLCGSDHCGPFQLQIWSYNDAGSFARTFAGTGPAWSPTLKAFVVPTQEARRLRIANDETATDLWLTDEEAERAAKEDALARVAELEAELARSATR